VTEPSPSNRLKYLPVSFFAMIMGLSGLSLAWERAEAVFALKTNLSGAILSVGGLLFTVLAGLYLYKLGRYPEAVRAELHHPIQLNFFPTLSISLVLLGTATLNHLPGLGGVLWVFGSAFHLLLTLYVMDVWIHHEGFEIHHINPAWFIPVVGNVLIPIAGTSLGFPEVSWFFFSVGILFWLVLLAIILYRVLFHRPLDEKLMPTFFILIAPPAAGFLAYTQLTGELDGFARVLYYTGLFFTLLLVTQINRFARLRFYLSWWAYSFPLAAMTAATLVMFKLTGQRGLAILAWVLLTLVTSLVAYLLYQTALAVSRKAICQPAT
jgi:tellurite resistance protein